MKGKPDALAPWKAAVGVYQEGALEVNAKGLRVNAAKLREPELIYEADFAWAVVRLGAVSLFFGKADLNKANHLRTRLEVRFPAEAFLNHFWKSSREFHSKIREQAHLWLVDPNRNDLAPEQMTAEKDHSQRANFDYIARYGSEAALDFYYLGPSGVARLAQGQGPSGLHMDPVVRVQTTTQELLRILDQLEPLVQQLAAQVPEAMREDENDEAE